MLAGQDPLTVIPNVLLQTLSPDKALVSSILVRLLKDCSLGFLVEKAVHTCCVLYRCGLFFYAIVCTFPYNQCYTRRSCDRVFG